MRGRCGVARSEHKPHPSAHCVENNLTLDVQNHGAARAVPAVEAHKDARLERDDDVCAVVRHTCGLPQARELCGIVLKASPLAIDDRRL